MPLTVEWRDGVFIGYRDVEIVFDPQKSTDRCKRIFVTHAHLDHAKASTKIRAEKVSTRETVDLLSIYKKKVTGWRHVFYKEKVTFDSLEIVAHNAGHVLGSSLFQVNSPEGTILYTGDFQFVDSFTLKAAEAVSCDILILEATFGSPFFVFPDRRKVASMIVNWANKTLKRGKIPIFKADSLGNAQEIIKIFNLFSDIQVIVHPRIAEINRIYESHGCRLESLNLNSVEGKKIIASASGVLVAPKAVRQNGSFRSETALVSGWALCFKRKNASFPLSDHADFSQLIRFVEACKPKIVLTCFGKKFDKILANQIEKKLRIEARPLNLIKNEIYLRSKPSYFSVST